MSGELEFSWQILKTTFFFSDILAKNFTVFCLAMNAVFTVSIVPYLLLFIFTVNQISNNISVIPCCPLNYLNIRQWWHEKFLQLRCIRWLSAVAWGDQTNIGVSLEETESLPWSLGQKRQRQWRLCGRDILPQEIFNLHPHTHIASRGNV